MRNSAREALARDAAEPSKEYEGGQNENKDIMEQVGKRQEDAEIY